MPVICVKLFYLVSVVSALNTPCHCRYVQSLHLSHWLFVDNHCHIG